MEGPVKTILAAVGIILVAAGAIIVFLAKNIAPKFFGKSEDDGDTLGYGENTANVLNINVLKTKIAGIILMIPGVVIILVVFR